MARFSALSLVSRAVAALLDEASTDDEFPKAQFPLLGTAVISGVGADENEAPPGLGVSVFPYRVAHNAQRRPVLPRVTADGQRFRPPVLLDLHLLISAWASSAFEQMRLLGWAARMLEDTPILTPGFLNRWAVGGETVFGSSESVEVVAEPLSIQELLAIWEVNKHRMQPSLGYVARMIAIDSEVPVPDVGIVRSRTFKPGVLSE